ncbi:uncharacterized protein QC761_104335 [Podospora bellae-mahoneyi]|uniref:Uncharacterized protein n=1 Tax=Podospora bellae-mahoneyi TaxID=2093777 RepID=A0ABR0FV32_9PEZI|nr:hypothetical protein QC761_104335 [Podospora bellae-mahoneyi]
MVYDIAHRKKPRVKSRMLKSREKHGGKRVLVRRIPPREPVTFKRRKKTTGNLGHARYASVVALPTVPKQKKKKKN